MKKRVLVALLATALTVSMHDWMWKQEDRGQLLLQRQKKRSEDSDQEAADKVAELIDDIYVQERT